MENQTPGMDPSPDPDSAGTTDSGQIEELPIEISVGETAALLQSDNPPFLMDVREACERAICKLDDDRHLPMGNIMSEWESLPRDQRILVLCHHGVRSLHVTHFLRDKGLDQVQSIVGGIAAWSQEIDPSVPRY